jgi:glycerol-1-phosphate dehydrogenase [NAD(P)+]
LAAFTDVTTTDGELLELALRHARDTRRLQIGIGARHEVADVFGELFGNSPCMVIADTNTFAAAGRDVNDAMKASGRKCFEPLIFDAKGLYAEHSYAVRIQEALATNDAIPIAVGSGAINDLTKLATHRCGRQYLAVATAASMDGYTAFGASITFEGSKQTFDCPAPIGVVADLQVIATAPEGLNASGYADLVAKCPAGADWILADGLGIDPIDPDNWDMVQTRLRYWMAGPGGVKRRDLEMLRRLTTALMITGFAMQAACSSRPVSGADHQFSHLWDMEHHTHQGITPSHGFKVGIGTLASLSLYESVFNLEVENLDIDRAVRAWPTREAVEDEIAELFPAPELRRKALLESGEKYIDRDALRSQLVLLKGRWPVIRERLSKHLIPAAEVADMLAAAGCPIQPEQIGISRERLRLSFRKALHIRRRFTILDLVCRANLWDRALDRVFQSTGLFA